MAIEINDLKTAKEEIEKLRENLLNKDEEITAYLQKLNQLHSKVLELIQKDIEKEEDRIKFLNKWNIGYLVIFVIYFIVTIWLFISQESGVDGIIKWIYIINSGMLVFILGLAVWSNVKVLTDE